MLLVTATVDLTLIPVQYFLVKRQAVLWRVVIIFILMVPRA
jgi:hypothetical protein